MKTLLWTERLKLKRSKIIWIAIFSTIMVSLIVYMLGQVRFNAIRYIDGVSWYMNATQSLGSLYVFPAIIALIGSYLICRKEQDDTLKSLLLIPVDLPKLISAKIILTAFYSIFLYLGLFAMTLFVEALLHIDLLRIELILQYAKIYLLQGLLLFIAVSPIIAMVYRLRKGYWLALIFAEIYSFAGLFMGMQPLTRTIYPIPAALSLSGIYELTASEWMLSCISLTLCGGLSFIMVNGLSKKTVIE